MNPTNPPFPPHNPDYPDVNPATGDERETTEGAAVDDYGVCIICGEREAPWDGDAGVYVHEECDPDGGKAA